MLAQNADPIISVATASGRGAVGIVRVSGSSIEKFVHALLGTQIKPRQASYLPFTDALGAVIDKGLAIFFAAPHSYTGEDVLELQAHGGPVVLQLLISRCMEVAALPASNPVLPSLRMAQPGEFTQRAFLNGKMDLAQAEAVADLIDASTEAAARSAGQSLSGVFSKEIHALQEMLTNLRMLIEATLDFPEEDIDFLERDDAKGQLERLQAKLELLFARAKQGALLQEGIKIVIAGQPNAGKSSLLNALAGAELAIVTPIAGTTRDRVRQTIQIEGVPLHVVDTAGLRESQDEIERIGIAHTWQEIESADAVVFLHDLTRADETVYAKQDAEIARSLAQKVPSKIPLIHVWNKTDAIHELPVSQKDELYLSAKNGTGLEELRQKLLHVAGWQTSDGAGFIARERHLQALKEVEFHLAQADAHLASHNQSLDLLAEELRLSQKALGRITGEFTSDDLLGVIFSRFCIGK